MYISDADRQASVGFAVKQTTYIETEVNRIIYPDIQYPDLVPVDTSADPFAKTVTHFTSDMFGRAGWINGNANDIPLAGTEMSKAEKPIHMAGVGYGYGWEEVEYARRFGRNLPAEDAEAARRAYEEFVDEVAMKGDTEKGFEGLINHSSVTPSDAVTGGWDAGATPDQILADINAAIFNTASGTGFTSIADTVLLPDEAMMTISTTRIGDSMSVVEFLRRNNAYTSRTGQQLTIRSIRGLETAGAGDVRRMVAYRRNPNVLKLHIPMPHRFLPVYQDGALNFVVPGVFRLGGLDIRRPKEVAYIDGI